MKYYISLTDNLQTIFVLFSLLLVSFTGYSEDGGKEIDKAGTEIQFPVINGWKMPDEVQVFKPENLYEYIDGAAELYLSFNFQQLYVVEYTGPSNESMVAEIYFHRTPYDSFGIYSQERPAKGNFLNIGAGGYIEPPVLNFFKGNAYVKLNSYKLNNNAPEMLKKFAKAITDKISGNTSPPLLINSFPEQGKILYSEKYIAKNFLGFDFLHNAFTADYSILGNQFQLFIIEGTNDQDCEAMLRNYQKIANKKNGEFKEGCFAINDPYHGEVHLIWSGKYIYGALNTVDEKTIMGHLKLIDDLLNRKNTK